MSGGSLDYIYRRVEDVAQSVRERADTPLHHAFATHLQLVANALHDLEWVWSCDYGKGDEEKAIRAVIHPDAEMSAARERAEAALADLRKVLEETA